MNGSQFSNNVAVVNVLERYLHRLEGQKPPKMTFTYKTKRKLMVFKATIEIRKLNKVVGRGVLRASLLYYYYYITY